MVILKGIWTFSLSLYHFTVVTMLLSPKTILAFSD